MPPPGVLHFVMACVAQCGRALALAVLANLVAMPTGSAQEYPTQAVKLVIGGRAGETADILANALAPRYSNALGTPVLVEREASGVVATKVAAKAAPDGYTVQLAGLGALVIAPALAKNPYDPMEHLAPVCQVVAMPNVLLINPASPARGLDDFITLAKKQPNALSYAAAGSGMPGELAGEMFNTVARVQMMPVRHKTGRAALEDLSQGRVSLLVAAAPSAIPQVKAGKARALAVTANKRLAALPDVPTAEEKGLAYQASDWYGLVVPSGTPQLIIDRLHKETATIVSAPQTATALAARGIEIAPTLPEQFSAYIRSEKTRWRKVIDATRAGADQRARKE